MTQLSKVKQNIQNKDTLHNLKTHKKTNSRLNRLYELFSLTVPTEEVAHWQYETGLILIIFPLNLQTFF